MSISSETNKNRYTGNGTTANYSYGFKIFASDELRVVVLDPTDGFTETVLTETTHYTVNGAGDSSGSIDLVNGAFDWIDGSGYLDNNWVIVLKRYPNLKQETDLRNQGTYLPESVEDALDRATMLMQRLQDELNRTPSFGETSNSSKPTIAEPVAGRGLYFDANGDLQITSIQLSDAVGDAQFVTTSAGAADSGKVPALDANGSLDISFFGYSSTILPDFSTTYLAKTGVGGFLAGQMVNGKVTTVSGQTTYTMQPEDGIMLITAENPGTTVTLETADADNKGRKITVMKVDASIYDVTVSGVTLSSQYQSVDFISDGSAWLNATAGEITTTTTTAGAGDAGKVPALDVSGYLDLSFFGGVTSSSSDYASEKIPKVTASTEGVFHGSFTSGDFITHATSGGTKTLDTKDGYIEVDSSSGTGIVILKSAASVTRRRVFIRKSSSDFNVITVQYPSLTDIATICTQGETLEFASDGTNWVLVGRYIPSTWTTYTPAGGWSAYASWEGAWKRVGDSIFIRVSADFTGTPSGGFNFDIPSGLTFDTSKMLQEFNFSANVHGYAGCLVGSSNYFGKLIYIDTNTLGCWIMDTSSTYATTVALSTSVPGTWASGDHFFGVTVGLPITDWEG